MLHGLARGYYGVFLSELKSVRLVWHSIPTCNCTHDFTYKMMKFAIQKLTTAYLHVRIYVGIVYIHDSSNTWVETQYTHLGFNIFNIYRIYFTSATVPTKI